VQPPPLPPGHLSGCVLGEAGFTGCRLDLAGLRFARLKNVEFVDCVLTKADFSGADLRGARFARCDLSGAQFSKAQAAGARFAGCDYAGIGGVESLRGASVHRDDLPLLTDALATALGIGIIAE